VVCEKQQSDKSTIYKLAPGVFVGVGVIVGVTVGVGVGVGVGTSHGYSTSQVSQST
jgi:hypothetical protein